MKHTLGPWKVYLGTRSTFIITESPGFPPVWIAEVFTDCSARLSGTNASRNEGEANARLIAAAPDLLEVANAILDAMKKDAEVFLYLRLVKQLEDAVLKATGIEGEEHGAD